MLYEAEQANLLDHISRGLVDPTDPDNFLSSAIAGLLDLHLAEFDEFTYHWIDDLLDLVVEVRDSGFEVRAYLVWGGDSTMVGWINPFQGFFSRDSEGKITQYQLHFGDDERPRQPYKLHRRYEPSGNHAWSYRFVWELGSDA